MGKKDSNDYLRLHVGILLAGSTGLFGKLISLMELPLVWYRMIIAAGMLWLVFFLNKKENLPRRVALVKIGGCGCLLAIHWVLFYASIKLSNVSIGVVCIALNGFFTALIEPAFSRERASMREILLSMITLAGILLIFGLETKYRLGIVVGAFSSLFYTLFAVTSKRIQRQTEQSSSTMLLYKLLVGWFLLTLVLPVYVGLYPEVALLPTAKDALLILAFASIFTIGPFLTQLQALRTILHLP